MHRRRAPPTGCPCYAASPNAPAPPSDQGLAQDSTHLQSDSPVPPAPLRSAGQVCAPARVPRGWHTANLVLWSTGCLMRRYRRGSCTVLGHCQSRTASVARFGFASCSSGGVERKAISSFLDIVYLKVFYRV